MHGKKMHEETVENQLYSAAIYTFQLGGSSTK